MGLFPPKFFLYVKKISKTLLFGSFFSLSTAAATCGMKAQYPRYLERKQCCLYENI